VSVAKGRGILRRWDGGIVRLGAVHCMLVGAAVKEVDDDDVDWHQQACTVGKSNEIQMCYNPVSSPAY